MNKKILEKYSVEIYEIDPYSCEPCKKIWVDKNLCQYILIRINVYFTEDLLAIEIDEKDYTDRDHIFEEKRQKALEEKFGRKFIRIKTKKAVMQTMKLVEYKHLLVSLKTGN